MMHHHKLEHLVKKIVLLSSRSQSQWRPITVSVISSELLILLQPSLVWWDIIAILSSELLILLQPNLVSWYIIAILSSELLILLQPNLVSWYIIAILSSELLILLQPNLVSWYIIAILSSELLILLQPNLVSWYNVYHCYLIFWTADPAATKFSLMIHHCRPRRQTDMSPLLSFCLGLLLFLSGHFFANGAFSRFLFSRNSPVFFIKTVCYVRL